MRFSQLPLTRTGYLPLLVVSELLVVCRIELVLFLVNLLSNHVVHLVLYEQMTSWRTWIRIDLGFQLFDLRICLLSRIL